MKPKLLSAVKSHEVFHLINDHHSDAWTSNFCWFRRSKKRPVAVYQFLSVDGKECFRLPGSTIVFVE